MAKKKFKDEIKELREVRRDLSGIKEALQDGVDASEIGLLVDAFQQAKLDVRHVIQDLRNQPGFTGDELKEEIRDLKNIKKDLNKIKADVADGVDTSEIDGLVADVNDLKREITSAIQDLKGYGDVPPAGTTGGETGGGDDEEDPGDGGDGGDDGTGDGGDDEDDSSTFGAGTDGSPVTFDQAVFSDGVTEDWSVPETSVTDGTEYQNENGSIINSTDFVVGSRVLVKETDGYRYRVYMVKEGTTEELATTGKFNLVLATDTTPWN